MQGLKDSEGHAGNVNILPSLNPLAFALWLDPNSMMREILNHRKRAERKDNQTEMRLRLRDMDLGERVRYREKKRVKNTYTD